MNDPAQQPCGEPPELTQRQQVQEDEYRIPFHYQDLRDESGLSVVRLEYQTRLRLVKRLIVEANPARVIDVGCGDGRFCYEMAKEAVEVVGVDYSPNALRFARAFNPSVEFHRIDLERDELPRGFDAALCMETLEHLKPHVVSKAVASIAAALEPGGRLVVTVPSTAIPQAPKHYQHFTSRSLRDALEPRFRVQRLFGFLPVRSPRTLAVRLAAYVGYQAYPFRTSPAAAAVLRQVHRFADSLLLSADADRCEHLVVVCTRA